MNFKDFHYHYVPGASSWESYSVGKPDNSRRQQLPADVLVALENGHADEALEILKMHRKTSKLSSPLTWIISQKGREAIQSIFDPLMLFQRFLHQKRFNQLEKQNLPIAEQVLELTRQLSEQLKRGAQPHSLQQRLWKMLVDSAPFTKSDMQKIAMPELKNLGVMPRILGLTASALVGGLELGLTSLRTLFILPYQGVQKIFQMTQWVAGTAVENTSRLVELALTQVAKLWPFVKSGVETSVKTLFNPIKEGYERISNRAEAFVERNLERISEKYESWKEYINEHWEKMAEVVNERWEPVQRHIEERVKEFREFAERHTEKVKSVARAAVQKIEVVSGAMVLPLVSLFQQLQQTTTDVVRRGRERGKKKSSQFGTWAKKCSKPLLKLGKWSFEIVQKEAFIACKYAMKLLHFFERMLKKLLAKLAEYSLGVVKVLYFVLYWGFALIRGIPQFTVRAVVALPKFLFRWTLQPFIDAIEK